MPAGQVIVGTVVSWIVTDTVQSLDWPVESSAVISTVTSPGPTMFPAAGDWVIDKALQPVATTSPTRFGMAASQFSFTDRVLLEAQVVIVGGAAARTVTANMQLSPVPEQVTVDVPTANVEPDAGTQVTVPQVPLVVGSG